MHKNWKSWTFPRDNTTETDLMRLNFTIESNEMGKEAGKLN